MPADEDVSEQIRKLDLPGDGAELQEQRDSVRSAYTYLQKRESATPAAFQRDVFEGEYNSSSQFDGVSADEWWEYISQALVQLPGVQADEDEWRYSRSA